jgi:hypothetical protein
MSVDPTANFIPPRELDASETRFTTGPHNPSSSDAATHTGTRLRPRRLNTVAELVERELKRHLITRPRHSFHLVAPDWTILWAKQTESDPLGTPPTWPNAQHLSSSHDSIADEHTRIGAAELFTDCT